jgi:hypothetical protein
LDDGIKIGDFFLIVEVVEMFRLTLEGFGTLRGLGCGDASCVSMTKGVERFKSLRVGMCWGRALSYYRN